MRCYRCGMGDSYHFHGMNVYDGGRSIMPQGPTLSYGGARLDYSQMPGNLGVPGDYRAAE